MIFNGVGITQVCVFFQHKSETIKPKHNSSVLIKCRKVCVKYFSKQALNIPPNKFLLCEKPICPALERACSVPCQRQIIASWTSEPRGRGNCRSPPPYEFRSGGKVSFLPRESAKDFLLLLFYASSRQKNPKFVRASGAITAGHLIYPKTGRKIWYFSVFQNCLKYAEPHDL